MHTCTYTHCVLRLSRGMVCSRQPRSFQGVNSHGQLDGWTEGRRDGRRVLIEFCWNINMWNRIFQRVTLFVILLSFEVLSKGCQSSQNTTMLYNECTHTFLYVFGHCGKYMLSLFLILISKSWGGLSYTLVCWCCVCMYIGVFVALPVS
jgi:hypothetical protein